MVTPRTLQDVYDTGAREEGHICQLKGPPKDKSVRGYIDVPSIGEKLFFQESLSGIQKREIVNYRLGAKVQFSVDKNDMGFFAKNLYIKVRATASVKLTDDDDDDLLVIAGAMSER